MTFRLLGEETERVIKPSSIAAAHNVIDDTVQWIPNLDHMPLDGKQCLSLQRRCIDSWIAQAHCTRQSSKKTNSPCPATWQTSPQVLT